MVDLLVEKYLSSPPILIAFIIGLLMGLAITLIFRLKQTQMSKQLAEEIFRESESQRSANIEAILSNVKSSFGNLSLEALTKSTEELLKLAEVRFNAQSDAATRELDTKKEIINEQMLRMTTELENVSNLVKELEKDRIEKFGELTNQVKTASENTMSLRQTTNMLREALAGTKPRGQWGERMAEDVLQLAGFIENINYQKQKQVEGIGTRPDFTFLLPNGLKLHMDVKFPLDNYMRSLENGPELEQANYQKKFLKDVKARIKEVTSREYINPEQNTLDYVLLFIPNEQVYSFIHEHDGSIFSEAIKKKVVVCSPITLFAVLAVIRHAIDNFSLEKTSNEIITLLGSFKKQWNAFTGKFDLLGKRINDVQKEYESLVTTRRRQLERPLKKIEALKSQGPNATFSKHNQKEMET